MQECREAEELPHQQELLGLGFYLFIFKEISVHAHSAQQNYNQLPEVQLTSCPSIITGSGYEQWKA